MIKSFRPSIRSTDVFDVLTNFRVNRLPTQKVDLNALGELYSVNFACTGDNVFTATLNGVDYESRITKTETVKFEPNTFLQNFHS